MSEIEEDDIRAEIQKLLVEINKDMMHLKNEVTSLNQLIEKDGSLPANARMVNERLMVAAKEAGINLDDLVIGENEEENPERNESEHDASRQSESDRENVTQESTMNNEQTASTSNAASVAAATKKLAKKVKRTVG